MNPIDDAPTDTAVARRGRLTRGDIAMIVVIYAAAGALWILLSDALLLFTDDAASAALVSVFKGLGFVAVTALLLFLLLRRLQTGSMTPAASGGRFERWVRIAMTLAVVVIVVAGFLRVRDAMQTDFRQATDRLAAVADRERRGVETWLDARRQEATLLASALTPPVGDELAAATTILGRLIGETTARDALLTTVAGRITWSASGRANGTFDGAALESVRERGATLAIPANGHLDVITRLQSGEVLVLRYDFDGLRRRVGDTVAAYGDDARVFLAAPDGGRAITLAGTRDLSQIAGANGALESAGTPVEAVGKGGQAVVSLAHPVADTGGWQLLVEIDRDGLTSALGRDVTWIVGAMSLAMILPLAGGLLLTQRHRLKRMEFIDRQRDERVALASHYDTLVQKARDMILLIDDDDRIVDANEAAREAYGYSLETLQRMTIHDLVAPDERAKVAIRRNLAGAPGGALYESRHRRRDGRIMPVEVSARSLIIEGRQYRQALVRDVSRRHDGQARMERLTRLHRAVSDCNQSIVRGRSRDTLFADVCCHLVETGGLDMVWVGVVERRGDRVIPVAVHGEHGATYIGRLNVSLDAASAHGQELTAVCMREDRAVWPTPGQAPEGSRWLARAALPVHERGRVAASLNLYANFADGFTDDEQKVLETLATDLSHALDYLATLRGLRESEQRWGFALEGSAEGVWDRHIDTDEVFFSSHWKHMLGYGDADVGTRRSEWRKRVHPDDIDAVEAVVDAHLLGESEYYSCEYRMLTKDGEYAWILDRGKVIAWDDAGRPRRMIGTHTDITARKLVEERLREQARVLEESQAIARVGSWQFDPATDTFTASAQALSIHGTDADAFDGTRAALLALVRDDDRDAVSRWLDMLTDRRQPGEIEYRTKIGDRQVNARGVADAGEAPVSRLAGTVQDVTEWRATETRMQDQLDELRRWYEITLDREERIMDLKEEVNSLLNRLGDAPRYPAVEQSA